MNKYRRFVIIFLLLEICLIGICNLFVVQALKSKDEYSYRVDVARCVQELETGIPLEQIKLSDYPTLTRVSIFDAQEVCNEEYRVEEVQGKLYRFCYRRTVQLMWMRNWRHVIRDYILSEMAVGSRIRCHMHLPAVSMWLEI